MKVLILGCGWAGISLAYELVCRFPTLDVVVVEPLGSVGGLLRSEVVNGFTVDVGGSHVIFSRDGLILNKILNFLKGNYVRHHRSSYVLISNYLVPYPVENGLYVLPPEVRAEVLIDFIDVLKSLSDSWRPKNFLEWIYGFFGKWIANNYLIPYNLKVWKRPLNELSVDWVFIPGRLPIPDWRDVVRAAVGVRTEGYLEQANFYYPLTGGIQALHNSLLNQCLNLGVKVLTNFKLVSIRRVGDEYLVNNELRFDKVFNTLPLPELFNVLEPPEGIVRVVNELDYNSVVITAVALRKEAPNHHWVYIPRDDVIFHRYAWISNYSPYNVPKGYSLLITETTLRPDSYVDIEELTHRVVDDLTRLDVIRGDEVVFTKSWIHKYGYPIYRLNHNEVRTELMSYLDGLGIKSVGRWGSWHYWNIDRVYSEVVKLVGGLTLTY